MIARCEVADLRRDEIAIAGDEERSADVARPAVLQPRQRDVEEVVDETHQVARVPVDGVDLFCERPAGPHPEQIHRREDRRERVTELVPEDRKELVLRLARGLRGGAQTLDLLARGTWSVTSNAITRVP